MNNKVLVWDSSIYDMLNGGRFGGIAVQLHLWMKEFHKNGWNVHALSTVKNIIDENGFFFHKVHHIKKIDLFFNWIEVYRIIRKVHPDIILIRGAQRVCYPLSIIGKKCGAKVILFGASDINFVPGKANVGNTLNTKLYELAVHNTFDYIVTQNRLQSQSLDKYFNKGSLIIPNIWSDNISKANKQEKKYDVVWVSNFRRLKRAEWILYAAEQLPQYRFAIIGGPNDAAYYDEISEAASKLNNVDFLGSKSLDESSQVIACSRILACTSEYEGFPNTFLQAWAVGIPVISTVDPNNIILEHTTGCIINNEEDLIKKILLLLHDPSLYSTLVSNIEEYFASAHSATAAYKKLMDYIRQVSENEKDIMFD